MLAERIEVLRSLGPKHIQLGHEMLTAFGYEYPFDLLGAAVLNRSIRLIRGFSDLIANNFMSAAPLVRLQLDNLLRLHAGFLVKDPHGFVMDMLRGTQINKLKSQDGHRLTDAYLVDQLSTKQPAITTIYKKGCDYVHLSDQHIFHVVQMNGEKQMEITISDDEPEITNELRLDAVDTMIFVTQLVLQPIQGWTYTKAHPELVQEPLKRAQSLVDNGKKNEATTYLEMIVKSHPDPALVAEAKQVLAGLK